MKRCFTLLIIAVLGLAVSCSKQSPEDQLRGLLNEKVIFFNQMADKMEKASTGKEVAEALLSSASGMIAINAKQVALYKSSPELRDLSPDKFRQEDEALMMAGKRYVLAAQKAEERFKGDKDIEAASASIKKMMN